MLRRRRVKLISLLLVISLTFLLFGSCGRLPAEQSSAESFSSAASEISDIRPLIVKFLDVGQADAILITLPDGRIVLIDAGGSGGKDVIYNELGDGFEGVIDYAVFTHFDSDHIGGAPAIIESPGINTVILPDSYATTAVYDRLLTSLENSPRTGVLKGEAGLEFVCGGVSFKVLSPFGGEVGVGNESSVVVRLTYKNISMIFMGDALKANEEKILNKTLKKDLEADLIKIGHHGSRTSSSMVFLRAVSPAYAVISCGEKNPYGHPHAETLETLESLGAEVFRTDQDGTVTAVTYGDVIIISTEK